MLIFVIRIVAFFHRNKFSLGLFWSTSVLHCPVAYTNLTNHLTESIETVQKRALKCIYPGNEYADILCLTNLPSLKERRDSLCKKYFQNIMETTHRLNYLLPCQRCNQYDVRRFNKYPLPEIRTNRYRNSLIPWDCIIGSNLC